MPKAPTQRPKSTHVHADNIPAEMKVRDQWVCWKWIWKNNKWDKPPFDAIRGTMASSTDPSTWTSFKNAHKAYCDRANQYDGIGYVFSGEPDDFIGVDLDHCRDPEAEVIQTWTEKQRSHKRWKAEAPEPANIINRLNTYAEISPSLTGVKIFALGSVGHGGKAGDFEVYSSKRYFTVTGWRLPESPAEIADCNGSLSEIVGCFLLESHAAVESQPAVANTSPAPAGQRTMSDDALLKKARTAKNGDKFIQLYDRGDWSNRYASQSDADLALVTHLLFWLGNDPIRVDQAFRQSALFRDKWDKRCTAEGKTYGEHTIETALQNAPEPYTPPAPRQKPTISKTDGGVEPIISANGRTDIANAMRLVRKHGQKFRWCDQWRKWMVWDDQRWTIDHERGADAMAKDVASHLWVEIAETCKQLGPKDIVPLISFAKSSNGAHGVGNMLALAKSEPGIPIIPDSLDNDPWLLNCPNGTVDLRTGELRPHRREDLITKLCPTNFNPDAPSMTWDLSLESILDGRQDLIDFMQRFFGYSLTGLTNEQALPIFWGDGSNGKSTVTEAFISTIGNDYAMQGAQDLLMEKRKETHSTERMDLFGRRFVSVAETDDNQRINEAFVKLLTGGERIRGRRCREDPWEFTPSHKIVLSTNHKPRIKGSDHAIWRRVFLIPFTVRFWNPAKGESGPPELKQDKTLGEKLKQEAEGILAWAVRGCLNWQAGGLDAPTTIVAATNAYRTEQDVVGRFIKECCTKVTGRTRFSVIYESLTQWCDDIGENVPSRKFVANCLEKAGYERSGTSIRYYHGVGVKCDDADDVMRIPYSA